MGDSNYQNYGALAGNQFVPNSGETRIIGNLGSFNPIIGSGTVVVSGDTFTGTSITDALNNAQSDFNTILGLSPDSTSSAVEIGGTTFTPGIYQFTSSVITISSDITLDGNGFYIFQFPTSGVSVTTNPTAAPVTINLINNAPVGQIFWAINGSLNLQTISGNTTIFAGTVIVQGNITLGTASESKGTLAAFSGSSTITANANRITSTTIQQTKQNAVSGYLNLESTLADNEAITINASNTFGGIHIHAGLGGIAIDTTNAINITAQAASSFVTSNGNMTLGTIGPTGGLLNLDGFSGINIGNEPNSTPINIGVTGIKAINIGNLIPGTQLSINAGGTGSNYTLATDGAGQDLTIALTGANDSSIILSSQGTGQDAINFNTSSGGLQANINNNINLIAGVTGNINIFSENGGINLITGPTGSDININSGNGSVNLVSNTNTASAIHLNATPSSGGITIDAGSFGMVMNAQFGGTIGIGNFEADPILLGTAGPNVTTIGNNVVNSRLYDRFGATGGNIVQQATETALVTSAVLTFPDILRQIYTINAVTPSTLTVDDAAPLITQIGNLIDGDSTDLIIINIGTSTATVTPGLGGTLTGNGVVASGASGYFRIRFNPSTTSYIIYRIA